MSTLLTPHFSLEELTTTSHTKYRKENLESAQAIPGKMYMLAGFAERVREIAGHPLIVTSGYRCPALNKAVGGTVCSQHLLAEAIDVICQKMPVEKLFDKLRFSDLKYDQIIIEQNKAGSKWVHISIGSRKQQLKFDGTHYYSIYDK